VNSRHYVDPRSSADFSRALAILADRVDMLIGYVELLRREAECLRAAATLRRDVAPMQAVDTKATADARREPALMFRFPRVLIERCGLTTTVAYRALSLGQIETVKIGRIRYVTAKALEAYVALVERLNIEKGSA